MLFTEAPPHFLPSPTGHTESDQFWALDWVGGQVNNGKGDNHESLCSVVPTVSPAGLQIEGRGIGPGDLGRRPTLLWGARAAVAGQPL